MRQALFAELFGTFLLVFVEVCTSIIDKTGAAKFGVLGISIGAMAAVATVIMVAGEISGAHINPAVTLAFALRRVFPWARVPLYWAAQISGAFLAAIVSRALFGQHLAFGVSEPLAPPDVAFLMESLLSWFLITIILASSSSGQLKGWRAAFPVAATLLFCGLIGHGVSGASMNPARSLAPAAVSGQLKDIWLYLTAPFLGAVSAVLTMYLLRGGPTEEEAEAAQGE